ncbi:MAG: ABC transporter ATP-binding protein [Clostridia bacterium]|nr:ABC transporter ATP-binding protein [Clostridia bacterium]
MRDYLPLLIVGGIIGLIAIVFIVAYATMKDKKEAIGFDRNMKDSDITRRLLAYARPHWKNLLLVCLLMAVSIVYDIVSPLIVGSIEKMFHQDFTMPRLLGAVTVYACALVVSLVSGYFQAILLQKTGQKIISSLREDVFTHIETLSHNQLHHIPVGKLVTRVTYDTEAISNMFTGLLVNLLKNCFIVLGVFVAMLCLNYTLTLMVLCFVPFVLLFTIIFRKFSRRAHRRVKDGTTSVNTFLSENLSGMKITQVFCREKKKLEEFDTLNDRLSKAKQQQILVFGIFRPLVYMLYISSVLCLLYLSGMGYVKDREWLGQVITSSTVVTFYMYISKFFNPIQNLAEQFNRLQSAYASAEKIFTILDTTPEVVDAPDAIELERVEGRITFEHVWFAYVEGEWILKDVSFDIAPGETVAFVGATGAGKTTILSLLCRNYDIQKGRILLDGIDITHIKIASLRRHFGQMLQDVFLFAGTVRSNILLHGEGISDEEIMDVCRYVNADTFISRLPHGLDEEVRERGNNFSAGQRQLISFARTIIHQPDVIILDEATANIDSETEVLIQNSLEKIMSIGTMLIVAHRLSTVRKADRIILLSHGEIAEEGSHEELLKLGGKYYTLYHNQQHKEALSGNSYA